VRSQLAAIFGNVVLAIPVAMLIAWLWLAISGSPFVSVEKSAKLLAEINPFTSGAVIYAGIAGVCLFLSGLIAGYHDNLAAYDKIPQRLRALGWLSRLLGRSRLDRLAGYIENNLGAIAGNFYFGCLLGGMAGLGVLLGLPIDIRHIAFSSAFSGFALVGLEFDLGVRLVLVTVLGLVLIGLTNLLVSFSLAIYVAMRSRKVTFQHWRMLLRTLARRALTQPARFLLPPGA
jgi:site-specific recombinase